MTRWKITVEYDGRPYAGWQCQDHVPSVQAALEKALKAFCQKDIRVHAAGRTDSGVHALGQVAHFDLDYGDRPLEGPILAKALNAHLRGEYVAVLRAEKVANDFHARFHAVNKKYTYKIINRAARLTLDQGRAWHVHKALDLDAMRRAAQDLIGHHDFTSFRDSGCQAKSPLRTLDRMEIETKAQDQGGGQTILFHAEGRSFLHHQVRNMVGTLKLIGEGKWAADCIPGILAERDRRAGGPTAPADGLCLVRVDYPECG